VSLIISRLGLETARVPHADRHGLLWLSRGELCIEAGCLRFRTAGFDGFKAGDYAVPHQTVSAILLGPGGSVTQDALRIMARHGTCLLAVGEGGVRAYTSPPLRPDVSLLARKQVRVWADEETRRYIARKMYAWRFGEILPHQNLDVLRGIEGARVKQLYRRLAEQHGVEWTKRAYDRSDPEASDEINEAINHAATALYAGAAVAVYSVGAIPQLGFIHEDSGDAFCLDVADLFRMSDAIPVAFAAIKVVRNDQSKVLERQVRQAMGARMKDGGLIASMIDRIKELFGDDDGGGHAGR
jgi:CRISPR-associated protein Cas1